MAGKLMLFDSHSHLNDSRFDGDRDDIASGLKSDGVGRVLECASSMSNLDAVRSLSEYTNIYAAFGVHPHSAKDVMSTNYIQILKNYADSIKCVAIGEIGLDYHYDNSPRDEQKQVFREQLALAIELDLPVVLHVRDAYGDSLDILREFADLGSRGVLHCFSGSVESASELLKLGFYFGFGGTITYKNARKTIETAEMLPLDRILLETDCPYLAPVPMRGKRNEPKFVRFACAKLAQIKGVTFDEMAKTTFENANKLFGI